MASDSQKRPRGGQVKDPLERKRNNLTFRVRDELKSGLESEAAKNSRSLSAEIEYRLEQSFVEPEYRLAVINHNLTQRFSEESAKQTAYAAGLEKALEIALAKASAPASAELKEMIERAVEQAVAKTLEGRHEPEPKNAADVLRNETPKL